MIEERPTPKTKQQLITLLKQQLEAVQDQISSMQQTLQSQRQKRKQLTQQLKQKQQKIQELIQNQSKTLGDKVSQGLYTTLEAANKMRAQAEAQVRKYMQDNTLLNQKITHKDTNVIEHRIQTQLYNKKISVLQQKKTDAHRKQITLMQKKQQIYKNLQIMKKQHQRIQRQQKQLRIHIQNTKKLRLYLNKNLQGTVKIHNNNNNNTHQNNNLGKSRASNADNFWNAAQ